MALAIHEGTRIVIENNWDDIEIESNSLIAINNIREEIYNWRITINQYSIYDRTIKARSMEGHPEDDEQMWELDRSTC